MSEDVDRFDGLDTCVLSDALDLLGLPGAALGLRQLTTPRRLCGRTVTVRLGPHAPGLTVPGRHLCTAAVEAAGPGQVIVVDHGGRTTHAGWGGLLSLAAARRGVEGVIVDGAVRDVDEARELTFPVFARCGVPVTARGRSVELEWGAEVDIAGVSVTPGDLVVADASGVVFVSAERAEDVLAEAHRLAAAEREMARRVDAGEPVSAVMGRTYESLVDGEG